MKYKVGDKVRVKSKEELENLDMYVSHAMMAYTDEIVTISAVNEYSEFYCVVGNDYCWTDEMFVGLAEETPTNDLKDIFEYGTTLLPLPKITKLLLVEDGSVDEDDIDKLADLGITVLVYRKGAAKPELIDLGG